MLYRPASAAPRLSSRATSGSGALGKILPFDRREQAQLRYSADITWPKPNSRSHGRATSAAHHDAMRASPSARALDEASEQGCRVRPANIVDADKYRAAKPARQTPWSPPPCPCRDQVVDRGTHLRMIDAITTTASKLSLQPLR